MGENKILLGTSGWSYKEWIGPLYSKEDKSMLKAYTKVFKTVEIDSTFYRYPSKGMVMGWTKYSPEGFVFTAKLPQQITHEKKLDVNQGVKEDIDKFIEIMEPLWLGGKLGCVLIQLPPKFTFQPEKLDSFFKILPTQVKFAVEFRDHSWMREETWSLLKRNKVAYTVVDEPLLPPEIHVTSEIAYFRWHGRGDRPWYDYRYKPDELKPWVPKLKETNFGVKKVFGYFNNHYHGYAVENCLQVLDMLGVQTPQQEVAKNKVQRYLNDRERTKEVKLETFAEPAKMSFEELLRFLTAPGRLERARDIGDSEVKINLETTDRVEAEIKDYHIVIDLKENVMFHDCADWGKMLQSKKLCKHVARLFLSMNGEEATNVLRRLYMQRETWQFRLYVTK
ncbi:MAG TPA: DUF72 domain-containing protein [Candidatus Acidoferrum sp.]|nr:DUF72 domain-containing protein [Candidatus Acidoferrum sp.]